MTSAETGGAGQGGSAAYAGLMGKAERDSGFDFVRERNEASPPYYWSHPKSVEAYRGHLQMRYHNVGYAIRLPKGPILGRPTHLGI